MSGDERERVLDEIRRLTAEAGGKVPGQRKFQKETGFRRSLWQGEFWTTFSAAVREAGFEPNAFTETFPEDQFFRPLAELARAKGRFPTQSEIKYAANHVPGFPSLAGFRNRFGNTSEVAASMRAWCEKEGGFVDILGFSLPAVEAVESVDVAEAEPDEDERRPRRTAHPQLSNDWLPPIVACLADLASGSSSKGAINEELEFERRTGVAFSLLGLQTEQLGQGTGRQADGIAACPEQGWAIIYDAKLHQGPYRIGTEDRKFREYVERHQPALARSGITKIYFVVVSGSFVASDIDKAREVVRLTAAKSCVLLTVEALLRLVEIRLSEARSFDYHWLERQFLATQVLSAESIVGPIGVGGRSARG